MSASVSEHIVLGPTSPANRRLEKHFRVRGEPFYIACRQNGDRVRQGEAVTHVHCLDGRVRPITVLCGAPILGVDIRVPSTRTHLLTNEATVVERFFADSPLSVFLSHYRVPPAFDDLAAVASTPRWIAAAYRGQCPGISTEAFANWRLRYIAELSGTSVEEVAGTVEYAADVLMKARRILVGDTLVADLRNASLPPDVHEAAARTGIPFLGNRLMLGGGMETFLSSAESPPFT